ncbi:ciliary microtubule inner protein 6 isoform X1 [Sminthopsis crassicaudata]|uniref:ciliary microtubule inner protein 6 isoform X1 n=1 Tax=Sminthopsis crassicaudata TaxID=9301 RepID=UPI003D68E9EC
MTRCQDFESSTNNKKIEDDVASSKEGDGKDNSEISDVHLPAIVEKKEKDKHENEVKKTEQNSENTHPRRPIVMYAKFIRTNARFSNEPVGYIDHPDMRDNQEDWWQHEEILSHHYTPSYDSQTTQRSDFKAPECELVLSTRHCRKQKAACGIVPLAISDTLPVIEKRFTQHFPFIHQFRKGLTPKHHGAFLPTDIKPVRRPTKGIEASQNSRGSRFSDQSKTETTSTVTSSHLCHHSSQRSPISECHLSEKDVKGESKAYLTAPGKEQKSPGISGTDEVNFILPPRKGPLYPPIKQRF